MYPTWNSCGGWLGRPGPLRGAPAVSPERSSLAGFLCVVLTGPELIDKLRVAVYVHLGNYIWAEFATESVVDGDGRGHEPRTASR
jgi:hypothetical protein